MINLTSPATIRQLQQQFGISTLKQLGQNFLCDANILAKIASSACIDNNTAVLEIGPGMGALTQQLALRAKKVVAVEIDRGLLPVLDHTLSDFNNIEIIHADILKQDLGELYQKLGSEPFAVCANLPYYITTAIIMSLIESDLPITTLSFLIQKEVAERMGAKPSTKSYGSLSIAVQYYTDVEVIASVPPQCFVPAPTVDSLVIKLTKRTPKIELKDKTLFFTITNAAFAMRRKTLINNLSSCSALSLSKEQAANLLKECKISENIRGEALSLEQFGIIANALAEK